MKNNVKIFVSYHKDMPYFKSDIFQPIFCGAFSLKKNIKQDFLKDNFGENISDKNIYYSELTGHYWVLNNYLKYAEEDYIGFCHYRRFWDLLNVSQTDYPSAFGVLYQPFKKLFQKWKKCDITKNLSEYDIILPCKSYFTDNLINPIKPTDGSGHTFEEYFEQFHVKKLSDTLLKVLKDAYPEYYKSAKIVFSRDYMYPYNMYIMKTPILKEFLTFMFDIFNKIENEIGDYKTIEYQRQFGFLSEIIVNLWLEKNLKERNLKIGYCPFFMLDFETTYLEKAVLYKESGAIDKAIKEILKIIKYTDNKSKFFNLIAQMYFENNDYENTIKYAKKSLKNKPNTLSCLILGDTYQKNKDYKNAIKYLEYMLELDPTDNILLKRLMFLAEQAHDRDKYEFYFYKQMKNNAS